MFLSEGVFTKKKKREGGLQGKMILFVSCYSEAMVISIP